jgi:hypothetical protein
MAVFNGSPLLDDPPGLRDLAVALREFFPAVYSKEVKMMTDTHSTKEDRGVRSLAVGKSGSREGRSDSGPAADIGRSPYMAAQRKTIEAATGRELQKKNDTNMPDEVKSGMETSFDRDFSEVRVHSNSSKAPEVGALAYTQGSDIHFAPGQYSPDTSAGRQLLGHELAHVVQQSDGRVSPTTEVNGIPVNDSPALEDEADKLGSRAAGK